MGFTIEQECPQCGAPIELDETDHVLRCPYCGVNNFLFAPHYYRFVLPHKVPDKEIIYVPYLRFKGNVYFCMDKTVSHRIVDITHVGVSFKNFPISLGVRPQAMKMRFVTQDTKGLFLKFSLRATEILAKAGKQFLPPGKLFHRAYIGEALSIIYLPMFVENNKIFDAVLKRPIANLPEDQDIFEKGMENDPRWKITFMATLCPRCGWNLEGERDSVVLTCSNCETAWEASEGRFVEVNFSMASNQGKDVVYLPFWKISASATGLEINSFADFVRVTNQPTLVTKEWEDQDMGFWSPAFKIRPKTFLKISRQFTICRKLFATEQRIPKQDRYPVTLPRTEAAQAMKVILAGSAINKKKVLPLLPRIRFKIKDYNLIYLPFRDTGHEMIQEHMGITINKKALEFGRFL